jgi:hypothetical protein
MRLAKLNDYLHGLFAFCIAVAFMPGIAGAATSPRWAIAALSLWFMDWFCLPFAAICFVVLDFDSAVHWSIICGAFCWGLNGRTSECPTIERERIDRGSRAVVAVIMGFSIGVGCSGALAIFQSFGFQSVPQVVIPGGLFLNKNFMGEAAALAIIASIGARLWWPALICLPALVLAQSRAAILASFCGAFLLLPSLARWLLVLVSLAGGLLAWYFDFDIGTATLLQRVSIWQDAIHHLTWFGNGSYDFSTVINREPNLHNDPLQLIYELGLVGLIPLFVIASAATVNREALAFTVCFLVIASLGFPLHVPASAWFGAFMFGHFVGLRRNEWGSSLRSWCYTQRLQVA